MTKIRAKRPSGSVSVRFAPSTALTLTFATPEPSGPFKRTAPFSAAACMAWEPSGLMLGLGETREEVLAVMRDLRVHHVDILTLGQYLRHFAQASAGCVLRAARGFCELRRAGFEMGFRHVEAGSLVQFLSRLGSRSVSLFAFAHSRFNSALYSRGGGPRIIRISRLF
jgi:hypothetical protein